MADKFALDKYAGLDSLIHYWHPKYKIIGISLLIFSFAFIKDIWRCFKDVGMVIYMRKKNIVNTNDYTNTSLSSLSGY